MKLNQSWVRAHFFRPAPARPATHCVCSPQRAARGPQTFFEPANCPQNARSPRAIFRPAKCPQKPASDI